MDYIDHKVYVYALSDGTEQTGLHLSLVEANGHAYGITLHGDYLYVVDGSDDYVYVYDAQSGAQDTTLEFTLASDNTEPRGLTTDGTYFYVIDNPAGSGTEKVFVYDLVGTHQPDLDFDLSFTSTAPTASSLSLTAGVFSNMK